MKLIISMLAVIGGAAIAIQSQVNGGLGKKVGILEGAFISFAIGTLALLFTILFWGKGNVLGVFEVPKWQLIGGLLGAFYVAVNVFAVPKIGVTPTLMAIIVGQIVIGAIIDHFGFFGGVRFPIDGTKMIAILLMFVAIYLFNR